jgi:hypothetical protein
MAENINLTVDRREDLFLQIYWTDFNDVPFFITGGFMDAFSGATKILSSSDADSGNANKYAAADLTVTPPITSSILQVNSESGLITISVPYAVVSGWSAGNYAYSLVAMYTGSVTTESSYRKVIMTGTLEVV